jgi:hypothetical protein
MRPLAKPPEATQEVDAADVLEMSEVLRRDDERSSPSLMRVGIDLDVGRFDETVQVRLFERRKKLARYVVAAVTASCCILVASFVKYASSPHAGTSPGSPAAPAPSPVAVGANPLSPPAMAPPVVNIPPPPVAPPPAAAQPPVSGGATSDTSASGSGTVRFVSPAKTGIWLDGKRLTGNSAIVSCGAHQVKVGYYAKHGVTVPCGGELVLSR